MLGLLLSLHQTCPIATGLASQLPCCPPFWPGILVLYYSTIEDLPLNLKIFPWPIYDSHCCVAYVRSLPRLHPDHPFFGAPIFTSLNLDQYHPLISGYLFCQFNVECIAVLLLSSILIPFCQHNNNMSSFTLNCPTCRHDSVFPRTLATGQSLLLGSSFMGCHLCGISWFVCCRPGCLIPSYKNKFYTKRQLRDHFCRSHVIAVASTIVGTSVAANDDIPVPDDTMMLEETFHMTFDATDDDDFLINDRFIFA